MACTGAGRQARQATKPPIHPTDSSCFSGRGGLLVAACQWVAADATARDRANRHKEHRSLKVATFSVLKLPVNPFCFSFLFSSWVPMICHQCFFGSNRSSQPCTSPRHRVRMQHFFRGRVYRYVYCRVDELSWRNFSSKSNACVISPLFIVQMSALVLNGCILHLGRRCTSWSMLWRKTDTYRIVQT